MNIIFSIQLYRHHGMWVFDDAHRNLVAEPFVLGATELIDYHLTRKEIEDSEHPVLIFSEVALPDFDIVLKKDEHTTPDSAYFTDQFENRCWLCPAQVLFFGYVPDTIYCKVKA